MLAARVEQKNGTYVHNIQTDIQSSPHPTGVAMFGINPDRRSHRRAILRAVAVAIDPGGCRLRSPARPRGPQRTGDAVDLSRRSCRDLASPGPSPVARRLAFPG